MRILIVLIPLLSGFFTMAQTRDVKPVPRNTVQKVNRDVALERAALDRLSKLATVMQPETRAKLGSIAGDLVSRISRGSDDMDFYVFIRQQVRANFPKLSADQSNLFNFFVSAEVVRLSSLKSNIDSMNELSEMTSLRLQMAMDRRSKFISTLSQIMKKISSTNDTLVQNIK